MAYVPTSLKDKEMQAGSQGMELSAAPTASNGPAASAAPAAATPSPTSGGAFPGVMGYLKANRGGAMQHSLDEQRSIVNPNSLARQAAGLSGQDEAARTAAVGPWNSPSDQQTQDNSWNSYLASSDPARQQILARSSALQPANHWDRAVTRPDDGFFNRVRSSLSAPRAPDASTPGSIPVVSTTAAEGGAPPGPYPSEGGTLAPFTGIGDGSGPLPGWNFGGVGSPAALPVTTPVAPSYSQAPGVPGRGSSKVDPSKPRRQRA